MNFYISDLHLGHRHLYTKEEEAQLLENWNRVVSDEDTVYILGDISNRGKNEDLIALVARLKGKKVLIVGNHEDTRDYRYKQLFHAIYDYLEITDHVDKQSYKLVLCHYPILMWNGQHNGTILLYGHLHDSIEEAYFKKCLSEMNGGEFAIRRPHEKEIVAINVGCMMPYMDYTPRTLSEILDKNQ